MSTDALKLIDGGRAPRGWEALWAVDVWAQRELPHGDLASDYRGNIRLRFDRLEQPWLKEAAKRWTRARLLGNTTPSTMKSYLSDLRHFSQWLATAAPEVRAPAHVSRELLEDYMLWVRTATAWKSSTKARAILALRRLLDEQADDGLSGLPRTARIIGGEVPRVEYALPEEMSEHVFAQCIDPDRLARLRTEQHRTVMLVLAFTGFRVSSVATLPRDCLHTGPDGHPYLRYWNIKAKREAMLPIPEQLREQLGRQHEYIRDVHPDGTAWLLPSPPGHKGGAFHIGGSTVNGIVKRAIPLMDIRSDNGKLATGLYPHLFRHHLGTSMVNDGIPLTVIQDVLGHGSMEMTAHYARLRDDTIRREVHQWHARVNARGERIALPADGPLAEAAWMKERIALAKQALPNGYCGLPLVQTCPHPNACLSCNSFLTDASFRPVHEQHQDETMRLLASARAGNNLRLVDVLERDHAAITAVLDGLDALTEGSADHAVDLVALAQQEYPSA